MPTIPTYTPGASPDPAEFYRDSLYNPKVTPDTFEVLQGGLDQGNLVGNIPGYAVRSGAFVAYAYRSYRALAWNYARQSVGDGNSTMAPPLLSLSFTLPWDAALVRFGWFAWCRQDATYWDQNINGGSTTRGSPPFGEYWWMETRLDNTMFPGCKGRLPYGRATDSGYLKPKQAGDPDSEYDVAGWEPGYHAENRWRYFTTNDQMENVDKGRHRLQVLCTPQVFGNDPLIAKLLIPSGGIWVMAYR